MVNKIIDKALCFLMIGCIFSCAKEDIDTAAPLISYNSMTPIPVPAEICGTLEDSVFIVSGGDILSFNALFQDDTGLSQFKVDIHNNFDCHGHNGAAAPGFESPSLEQGTEDWTILEINPISGTTENITKEFSIPENVTAGNYHYQIQVLDEVGNDNIQDNIFSLKIRNPRDSIPPVITVNKPQNSSFNASKGSKVVFSGMVIDDQALEIGGNGVVFLSYTDLKTGNVFSTGVFAPFLPGTGTSYTFNLEYSIPLTLIKGDYSFTLSAFDGVRNTADPISFQVNVTD